MRHEVKLTKEEKAKIWLDLCGFSFELMRKALSTEQLKRKLERMRQQHLEKDKRMFGRVGR